MMLLLVITQELPVLKYTTGSSSSFIELPC
jgi:hypothetical protein